MKITRRQLRSLIREELLREVDGLSLQTVENAHDFIRAWINQKNKKMAYMPTKSVAIKSMLEFIGGKELVGFHASLAGAATTWAIVYHAFTALPEIMTMYLKYLSTALGSLSSMSDLKGGPINVEDIADERSAWIPPLGGIEWDRQKIIDYLASSLELNEGRALLSKLTAPEHKSQSGLTLDWPIISREFHAEILKRRPELQADAKKNLLAAIQRESDKHLMTPSQIGVKKTIAFAKSLGWTEASDDFARVETFLDPEAKIQW